MLAISAQDLQRVGARDEVMRRIRRLVTQQEVKKVLSQHCWVHSGVQVLDCPILAGSISYGRDPYDKSLANLVGELSTRSDEFRVRWGAHDVQLHRTGLKHIRHPIAGELHLSYEVMELLADPGLALVAFSAEAGSPDDDALRFVASWATTHEPAGASETPN
jgi:hypothetical protein